MKKKLLFTLAFLAVGFGVSQVFLQGEDAKKQAQIAHSQSAETPITKTAVTEASVVQPQPDKITQSEIAEPQIADAPVAKPPVIQSSEPEGDSFYFLLHPDRKNSPENLDTEQAKN